MQLIAAKSRASRGGLQERQRLRHFLAGAIQSASLYFVFAFRGVQWLTPWLVYFLLARIIPRRHRFCGP